MKKEYVEEIIKQLEACEDIGLLDLIMLILKKDGYADA